MFDGLAVSRNAAFERYLNQCDVIHFDVQWCMSPAKGADAVVSMMIQGEFQSYWSQTGTYESIVPLISMDFDGLKTSIITMISGERVQVRTKSYQNDMITFKNKDDVMTAYIPNEEIRSEFTDAVEENSWDEFIEFRKQSMCLLEATIRMDEEAVAEGIEKIHMEYASSVQYHDENSLSSVLTIAYLSAMKYFFKPVRELPTGRGFADFVFIPKQKYTGKYPVLLVELKWDKDADTAIRQIREKNYQDALLEYTGIFFS